jgi:peptidoglycan glycosyltransferase
MKQKKNVLRRNIMALLIVFIIMFSGLIVYLGYVNVVYGERWFATPYNPRIQNMKTNVAAGDILDRTGRKLLFTKDGKREYIEGRKLRESIAHIIGDEYGLSYGAQTIYSKYLYGQGLDTITQITQLLSGEQRKGGDVKLTIDSKLCQKAMDALGGHDGAVVVMNYKTGEIIASVSSPSFDPADMKEFQEGGGTSELVNRAFSGLYAPGSTFKLITSAALIESGNEGFKTTCKGGTEIGGKNIACTGEHGDVDLESALVHSCNVYFAEAAHVVGKGTLAAEAEKFLYNKKTMFSEVVMKDSVYETGGSDNEFAWSAVGQHHDLITPLQSCMIAACIANDGVMMEPKLLLSVSNGGTATYSLTPSVAATPLDNTDKLKSMMVNVVKSGTGKKARIKGVTVAGKTGTAQVQLENGEIGENAWFVGFIEEDEHPLAIAVVMERAGAGSSNAAPAAKSVLARAIDLGY